jgi:hypothetical protein
MGVAAVLVIACWIGFTIRRPLSPSGVSGPQASNAFAQQIPFAPALGRGRGKRKTSKTIPGQMLGRNIEVRYFSDDVTVRYFTPQPPPQRLPDGYIRVRYFSDDVTVRYFLPEIAEALPSTPKGSPAQSVSSRDGSSILPNIADEVRSE